jgi:hypothetical protein
VVFTQRQPNKAQTPTYVSGLWLSIPAPSARLFELPQTRQESIRLESNTCRVVTPAMPFGLDKNQGRHAGTVPGTSGGVRRV